MTRHNISLSLFILTFWFEEVTSWVTFRLFSASDVYNCLFLNVTDVFAERMSNVQSLLHQHCTSQGLTDTKIVGSSSRYSPMSVLRAPSQTDLTQAYSQHSLHRSVSQLIDRKSLMMDEGCWDNPTGYDSGLVRTDVCFLVKDRKIPSGDPGSTFTELFL